VHRSTYVKRRAKSAAFAQDWDARLAAAHADFHHSGRPRPPELPPLRLVTGWSKADPDWAKAVHNPRLALFGGWPPRDWKRSRT
jgi:hypothetical protein